MREQIGKVTLNYEFYHGEDLYSDGDIEDYVLEIAREGKTEQALLSEQAWPIAYHFSPVREHILDWYPMNKEASVLEIGSGCGAITGVLSRKAKSVTCIELSKRRSMINAYQNQNCENVEIYVGRYEDVVLTEQYDYITLIGVFEYAAYYTNGKNPFLDMLKQVKAKLKPNGRLLIAIENRMGLKYLNGAKEDHTGLLFHGVEAYDSETLIRTFTQEELQTLLINAGYSNYAFYYPFPDYKLPQIIVSDGYQVQTGNFQGYDISFDMDRRAFFDEEKVFDTLNKDGRLGYFANSFFVEAASVELPREVLYARYSFCRKKEFQTRTLITVSGESNVVKKSPLVCEAAQHIQAFESKYHQLKEMYPHVQVVPVERIGDDVQFPFIKGKTLHDKLLSLTGDAEELVHVINRYLEQLLTFADGLVSPFEASVEFQKVFGRLSIDGEVGVSPANVDCIFQNIIESDGQLYCYDYEWVFPFAVPVCFIKYHILRMWYADAKKYLPYEDGESFLDAFGFTKEQLFFCEQMEEAFGTYTRGVGADGFNPNYLLNYMKERQSLFDLIDEQQKASDQCEIYKKLNGLLENENQQLKRELERHKQNEDRLRKAIAKYRNG